MREKGSSIPK